LSKVAVKEQPDMLMKTSLQGYMATTKKLHRKMKLFARSYFREIDTTNTLWNLADRCFEEFKKKNCPPLVSVNNANSPSDIFLLLWEEYKWDKRWVLRWHKVFNNK
jgi:hypothetical protein